MAEMFLTTLPPIFQQIQELQREISQREDLYPGFVKKKIITQEQAETRLLRLRAALATLEELEFVYEECPDAFSDRFREAMNKWKEQSRESA